jgi:PDZ domain
MTLYVTAIDENAAAQFTLLLGDALLEANGRQLTDADALRKVLQETPVGGVVSLLIQRGGEQVSVDVVLAESRSLGVDVSTAPYRPVYQPQHSSAVSRLREGEFATVAMAARSAKGAADLLQTLAIVLFALSAIGGLILLIAGVSGQCPEGEPDCYSFEKTQNMNLVVAGIAGVLFWGWILALSSAIAARLRLAAAVATVERG